jgi:7-cyano-7-deazaguanine reductase
MTDVKHLKVLGSNKTEYNYGLDGKAPEPSVLEKFANPSAEESSKGGIKIDIQCPEFTSLCPKTGQPDFASIMISYAPNLWCVESKSLKLYLMQFRMFGEFHEACVTRIGNDLVELLDPHVLSVTGQFTPRGGIKFWPTYVYQREQKIIRT